MVVVIIGAGIVGVSTAYFLSKRGISSILVEQKSIASAASGKAGGFLAKDWCSQSEMDILARKGFSLHMELMNQFGSTCDYRCVKTLSVEISQTDGLRRKNLPAWVGSNVSNPSIMGDFKTTAQVHPEKLTNILFNKAREFTKGETQLKMARAVGLEFTQLPTGQHKVTGVQLADSKECEQKEVLSADAVLLCAGPWTNICLSWLPTGSLKSSGFGGHRAHSVVLKPNQTRTVEPIDATCLFTEYNGPEYHCSPEVYPRPDGTVYVCGLSDGVPVPQCTESIVPETWRCDRLREVASMVSPALEGAETVAENACFLPLSPDGVPVIGKVPNMQDLYIGTGHSCWGILTGPITGRFLAAMIARDSLEASTTFDISNEEMTVADQLLNDAGFRVFDPARFIQQPSRSAKLRTNKKPD